MTRSIIGFVLVASLSAQEPAPKPFDSAQGKPGWQMRLEQATKTSDTWKARREDIRRQILAAAGLWPEFERPPLKPVVFGRIEREDYTVEKVRLETLPGLHLTGNLYRPLGKKGPFPGVVCPHGHWKNGRFEDQKDASIPGRSLTLARLGFVVFTYDMVGFGDFKQLPHKFDDPATGIGLLGVQLWSSLRAVDFIASLPDVDPKRIGATGASGGGTQTFLLAAVDDRVQCAIPVNMVAAEFQGGCSCENAPYLRIGLNNVEIAAATAPRALMLISCTGDWTKHNMTLEGPVLQQTFKTLGVPEKFRVVQFNYGHNYNKDSREAAYAFLVRWLQSGPDQERIPEPDFTVEKREDLAVYAGEQKLPGGAVDSTALHMVVQEMVRKQLEQLRPKNAASLKTWRDSMAVAFRKLLTADGTRLGRTVGAQQRTASLYVGTKAEETAKYVEGAEARGEIAVGLTLAPHEKEVPAGGDANQRKAFVTTFYRTALSWQVQDILDELGKLAGRGEVGMIRLVGIGEAGLPALCARAVASNSVRIGFTIIDASAIDAAPALNRVGGWLAAATTAEPGTLVLHGKAFDAGPVKDAYKAAGREGAVVVSETLLTLEQIHAMR